MGSSSHLPTQGRLPPAIERKKRHETALRVARERANVPHQGRELVDAHLEADLRYSAIEARRSGHKTAAIAAMRETMVRRGIGRFPPRP